MSSRYLPAVPIKTKARSVVREILLFAPIIAVLLRFLGGKNFDWTVAIIAGVMLCPFGWIIYRFARFVVGR